MKVIKVRKGSTASNIARLHKVLAETRLAAKAILAVKIRPDACAISAKDIDKVLKLMNDLEISIYSLEDPFFTAVASRSCPLAKPSDPDVWLRFLNVKEAKHD